MINFEFNMPTEEDFRIKAIKRHFEAKKNKTCISYWHPKVKENLPEIRQPETYLTFFNDRDILQLFDGATHTEYLKKVANILSVNADKVGYPCFMKNSIFSGKHDWINTCFIGSKDDIYSHMINIGVMHYINDVFDTPAYMCIRKMIKTEPAFYAFNGMPITCERRYFAKDGVVYFHHPYWPPHSIKNPSVENWEMLLCEMNKESEDEIQLLTDMSSKVSNLLRGGWSIDWLKDIDGNWWLTDMAEDYKSSIWSDYKKD